MPNHFNSCLILFVVVVAIVAIQQYLLLIFQIWDFYLGSYKSKRNYCGKI